MPMPSKRDTQPLSCFGSNLCMLGATLRLSPGLLLHPPSREGDCACTAGANGPDAAGHAQEPNCRAYNQAERVRAWQEPMGQMQPAMTKNPAVVCQIRPDMCVQPG